MILQKHPTTSKTIRLRCVLGVAGRVLNGETRDLSETEATAQFPLLAMPDTKKPEHGASGLLTLSLSPPAQPMSEILRIPCHIIYSADTLIHMNLHVETLDDNQHKIFDELLK